MLVVGEALVDLVVGADDSIEAALGGAPWNAAVAAARLGTPVGFVGAVSTDRFGERLLARLVEDGVDTSAVVRVDRPTSLAMAELDPSGAATYRFYFAATSAPLLDHVDLASASVIATGGLALVLEPMATNVEAAVLEAEIPVIVDVNCRPAVIDDLEAYRARVRRIVAASSVVKVSDDDLEVLSPGVGSDEAAAALVELGAGAVVVTRGASSTTVITGRGRRDVPVDPLPPGTSVVDTIGAGDTFGAGLVTSLYEHGAFGPARSGQASSPGGLGSYVDPDVLVDAVRLGHAAAAITVTRRGADPPRRDELTPDRSRSGSDPERDGG